MNKEMINKLPDDKEAQFNTAVYLECLDLMSEVVTAYGYRPAVAVRSEQAADWICKKLLALDAPVNPGLIGIDRRSIALDSFRLLTVLVSRTSGPLTPNLVSWRALKENDKADAYRAAALYLSFEEPCAIKWKLSGFSSTEVPCVA